MMRGVVVLTCCDVMRGGRREAPPAPLDQKRDNRLRFGAVEIPAGRMLVTPHRSGGPFDPYGQRHEDYAKVDTVKAVYAHLAAQGGRLLMLTLTVDRAKFLSPEMAYNACNERLRKAIKKVFPDAVRFSTFELQTKTGDGWPHWHLLVWLPPDDQRSVEELKAKVVKRWITVHQITSVDESTGEVQTRRYRLQIAQPQCIQVELVKQAIGAATYVAKYLTKRWEAVPAWMGESYKRFRKYRACDRYYEVAEQLTLHHRSRGGRPPRRGCSHHRRRRLFDRMAISAARLNLYEPSGAGWKYKGTLSVPATKLVDVLARVGGELISLGEFGKLRGTVPVDSLAKLFQLVPDYRADQVEFIRERRHEVVHAWDRMQYERERTELFFHSNR